MSVSDIVDPRTWPAAAATAVARGLHAAAARAIGATTGREQDEIDSDVRRALAAIVASADGGALAATLASAPSLAVGRYLWRLLADLERDDARASEVHTTLFAMPLIVVAALEAGAAPVTQPGVLADARALGDILREARAFGGCETFALSGALCAADAIDIGALPAFFARRRAGDAAGEFRPVDLAPAPFDIRGGSERVFLRFVAGAVLTPPHVDPLREPGIGRWGAAFAQAIGKALRTPGVSLLALPRPPQRFVTAVAVGRAAQREVSAQIFASNAIRKLRASYGEPTATISAHRADDAPGGGELRLSLSSPFAPKEAEGFRCPIYAYESVQDVGAMLVALLRDCRLTDVRLAPGVHPDVDPITQGPLFFKDVSPATAAL